MSMCNINRDKNNSCKKFTTKQKSTNNRLFKSLVVCSTACLKVSSDRPTVCLSVSRHNGIFIYSYNNNINNINNKKADVCLVQIVLSCCYCCCRKVWRVSARDIVFFSVILYFCLYFFIYLYVRFRHVVFLFSVLLLYLSVFLL